MWGDAFFYEPSNKNCMVMAFDPEADPSPNLHGNPYTSLANTNFTNLTQESNMAVFWGKNQYSVLQIFSFCAIIFCNVNMMSLFNI